ncbi:polysaccharide synthesis [Photobacterium chitinilyticum]|uniref:Polysaccharide synthesis n=2 Tax=Photobacterium chitinilyticum TaxID=2485123 RepID=A0A3S3QSA3_9GAMM|nr:polysaccharide synthesis [Photobacterium chitinilyticum]
MRSIKNSITILIALAGLLTSSCLLAQTPSNEENAPSSSNSQSLKVIVTTSLSNKHQLQLSYPTPVRIKQVLSDSIANINQLTLSNEQAKGSIFWTSAALFKYFPHSQKQHVISQLELLAAHWKGDKRQAVLSLVAQLQQLQIGQRIFTSLDYDQIRVNSAQNPLVSQSMTLVLPPRPNSVLITGAVLQTKWVTWQERFDANNYLEHVVSISSSDNSEAWVIQPDGKVEQHPIAYWNQNHLDIAPGAAIYLGFSSLPAEFSTINKDIVNLLRNRAP